jgi:hypothetical protein
MTTKTPKTPSEIRDEIIALSPIRIDCHIDDDGVVIEARRSSRLVAMGIAMHEGRGQADTIRRAVLDCRREAARHGGY